MNVEIVRWIPYSELEDNLRTVPLLKARTDDGKPIHVYKDAHISLRPVSTDEINASTLYLLQENLDRQRTLRQTLLQQGIDTLNLDGAIELFNHDSQAHWTMIPPLVEVSSEDVKYQPTHGDVTYDAAHRIRVPVIVDGLHRSYLARQLGEPIAVIYIVGVPEQHPFYAYPNSWDLVRIFTEVPDQSAKKLYRRKDNYLLYRDLGVLGCGAPRKADGKDR